MNKKRPIKQTFLKSLRSQSGMAILFVLSSVTLLAFLLAEFTFDSNINKLRISNLQDLSQARLNAESGLKLALARLDLYKEARNWLEKKPDQKKNVPNSALNYIFSVPFIYPIKINESMNIIQKEAVNAFDESTLLNGEMQVFIKESSGLINLNLLRVYGLKNFDEILGQDDSKKSTGDPDDQSKDDEKEDPVLELEKKLVEMLENSVIKRSEADDEFANKYSNIDPARLIKTIKFYVNPKSILQKSPDLEEVALLFEQNQLNPKHAPLTSISELYLLPGWDDELVKLIENEITVHGNMSVDLNKITNRMLKLIIPDITDEAIEEFFKWRDDPESPNYINDLEEFKSYFTNNAIVDADELTKRIDEFKGLGIIFGGNSNLFRVVSIGKSGRAEYKLNAWVSMPIKPPPPPENQKVEDKSPAKVDDKTKSTPKTKSASKEKKKKRVLQFLPPRVVEIIAN